MSSNESTAEAITAMEPLEMATMSFIVARLRAQQMDMVAALIFWFFDRIGILLLAIRKVGFPGDKSVSG